MSDHKKLVKEIDRVLHIRQVGPLRDLESALDALASLEVALTEFEAERDQALFEWNEAATREVRYREALEANIEAAAIAVARCIKFNRKGQSYLFRGSDPKPKLTVLVEALGLAVAADPETEEDKR